MGASEIIGLLGGIALFLFGMAIMGDGLKKVAGSKLELVLYKLTSTPLKGVLLGTGVTAVIQSSSATSVMVVGFVNSGMMTLQQAVWIIMGANIGTTITAVLASLSASRDAKRVAAAHAVFNLTGAAVFCAGLPLYVRLTAALSPKGPELAVIARQIANAHTLFNVVCTLVWLPLTPLMLRFVCRLVPDRAAR
mgnify:CR=1 FL=1